MLIFQHSLVILHVLFNQKMREVFYFKDSFNCTNKLVAFTLKAKHFKNDILCSSFAEILLVCLFVFPLSAGKLPLTLENLSN